jgi:hypothetical protein
VLECECDFATLHNFLVRIPRNLGFPIEFILPLADELFVLVPPSKLQLIAPDHVKESIEECR